MFIYGAVIYSIVVYSHQSLSPFGLPVKILTYKFLDSGRKLGYTEETHMNRGRTYNLNANFKLIQIWTKGPSATRQQCYQLSHCAACVSLPKFLYSYTSWAKCIYDYTSWAKCIYDESSCAKFIYDYTSLATLIYGYTSSAKFTCGYVYSIKFICEYASSIKFFYDYPSTVKLINHFYSTIWNKYCFQEIHHAQFVNIQIDIATTPLLQLVQVSTDI